MLKYVLLTVILMLIVTLIVKAINGILQTIHDNVAIHRYNSKMNGLRKERILQEQEKQRRIRGETEDTPQYAAGDEKDRINRQSFYRPAPDLWKNTKDIIFTILALAVIIFGILPRIS